MILTFDSGLRIYYAGDTGLSTEMTIIRDYWRPDIAILPFWLTVTHGTVVKFEEQFLP